MINEVCNLQCKYCFANEFVDSNDSRLDKQIKIEDFKEIVEFILRTRSKIGILGGEPMLHPQITELIEYLISHKKVETILIFTNGICLERIQNQIKNPKVRLLVNLNSPNDIGENNYRKILRNMENISPFPKERISFGINMYKPGFDYDYIIEMLERYSKNNVRVAIVGPNSEEMRDSSYLDYCREIKSSVLDFFRELYKRRISPRFDCAANVFPPCILTSEERDFMKKLNEFACASFISDGGNPREAKRLVGLSNYPKCEPVIDFTIDKKVIRCFPMFLEKTSMNNFANVEEIVGYFKNRWDSFKYIVPIDESCRGCKFMKIMACQGGCIAYRVKEINRIWSMIDR
jgi:radical SAM protein with 4Fe4S-binding SPASM domain